MKKLIVIALILALISAAALAESIDLSGLSFQELAALRDRAQLEMMQRDEWQEVSVPQGVYQVGVHIPAGTWTIRCKEGMGTKIEWGDVLDASGQGIDFLSMRMDFQYVYNPEYRSYSAGDRTEYTFTVRDGDWIAIDDSPAVFTPGGVTPSFTFK